MKVLTNKKYQAYDKLSRYSAFPIYYHNIDKKWVGGTTLYLSDDTPYNSYRVQPGDTYDNLALYYYNNPTLFWVICSFNHIQDPFVPPKEGTIINIPVLSNIRYGE